ncbi:MAG TPA: RCC1 repeat-containing protein, partial [Archangium sp.]|nr:RCC1 repeat-containing protein [Archangium sp.]
MRRMSWTWKTQHLLGAMALLLLAAGCGEEKPNTPPTFLEGTQSATSVQVLESVTLRVTARDAESHSLRFSWEASAGTLGSPSDTDTTSDVTWSAPACNGRGTGDVTLTVTVSDAQGGSASRTFPLSILRCRALFIAGGDTHSLARLSDGTVWAWGSNGVGQLGDGTTTAARPTPAQVSGLTGIIAVDAGFDSSLAVRHDGTVWAWGSNFAGKLGDATNTQRTTPVQVLGLTGVTAVAAGSRHSLALRQDGTVWAWGANDNGQLGDGTTTQRSTPVQVSGLTDVTTLTTGYSYALTVRQDGSVWGWGNATRVGQPGDASNPRMISTPVQVPGLTGATAVSAGGTHALVLRNDGTVWGWGSNSSGQLGEVTLPSESSTPVLVPGLSGVTAIAVGTTHSLLLLDDGSVRTCGDNAFGQLGNGKTLHRFTPVPVSGLTSVTTVLAGNTHSLALRQDGTVWAWGSNTAGQLGDGTSINRRTPIQVPGLTGVTALAGSWAHSLALRQDGTLWAWGENNFGQLGDGTTRNRRTPVQVPGLTGITAIAASGSHSLALRQDGTVWAWGLN